MIGELFDKVRAKSVLVHSITNYVTANDCANVLLACGASPIMADDADEAADITAICNATNINIGTLNSRTIPAMFAAGAKASELSHPIVLDPVGVGASKLRTSTAKKLIEQIQFTVIRGNVSEIKALALGAGGAKGVDADVADAVSEETLDQAIRFLKAFARQTGAIIAATGAIDIITAGGKTFLIRNGSALMGRITGAGCMLSALAAAHAAANPGNALEAVAAAVCLMGLAGEIGAKRMTAQDGNSSLRNYIIDAVFNMTGAALEAGANYEVR